MWESILIYYAVFCIATSLTFITNYLVPLRWLLPEDHYLVSNFFIGAFVWFLFVALAAPMFFLFMVMKKGDNVDITDSSGEEVEVGEGIYLIYKVMLRKHKERQ